MSVAIPLPPPPPASRPLVACYRVTVTLHSSAVSFHHPRCKFIHKWMYSFIIFAKPHYKWWKTCMKYTVCRMPWRIYRESSLRLASVLWRHLPQLQFVISKWRWQLSLLIWHTVVAWIGLHVFVDERQSYFGFPSRNWEILKRVIRKSEKVLWR
jgi:hypothetical protein